MKNFCLILLIFLSTNSFCQKGISERDTTSVDEINPEFPGGVNALYKYINQNFKYPKSAIKAGYMGRISIKFVVEKDGKVKVDSINHSEMLFRKRKVKEELKQLAIKEMDAAIINNYESMPIWKPGTKKGQGVRVFYTTPINLYFD